MSDIDDYKGLIERVRRIDRQAAEYLENEAPSLMWFLYDAKLGRCFLWCETPQGHDYWERINELLAGPFSEIPRNEILHRRFDGVAK